jgi:hypothetical protein
MKLLDDLAIPIARSTRERYHSHKLLDIVAEMGLNLGRLYWTMHRHHHLNVAPPKLNLKTRKTETSRRREPRSIPPPWLKCHISEADQWWHRWEAGYANHPFVFLSGRRDVVANAVTARYPWFLVFFTSSFICILVSSTCFARFNLYHF